VTEPEIEAKLTEAQVLACTMQAEAAGDTDSSGSSVEERIAVGCAIRNRVRSHTYDGNTYHEVCLAREQFSCWTPGSGPNHDRLMATAYLLATNQLILDLVMKETLALAELIVNGTLMDHVGGATHYYAPKSMVPVGRKPAWVFDKNGNEIASVASVGRQLFYKVA
jgi:spore germination cell wall hydrolase CwlJ-like protein